MGWKATMISSTLVKFALVIWAPDGDHKCLTHTQIGLWATHRKATILASPPPHFDTPPSCSLRRRQRNRPEEKKDAFGLDPPLPVGLSGSQTWPSQCITKSASLRFRRELAPLPYLDASLSFQVRCLRKRTPSSGTNEMDAPSGFLQMVVGQK